MQAPLRLNLCIKCADSQPRSLQQLWDELEPGYKGESHFTLDNLQQHLQAMQAIGIFKILEVKQNSPKNNLEDNLTGNLANNFNDALYILTEYGHKKMQKALK